MKKNAWIYIVFLWTFILSVTFSSVTNLISFNSNIIITLVIIILVISIGILFDMIGASSLTSKESSFHAMNSKKIKGAKQTIRLIKNNVKVSSVCNDIVGDICGILSGGLGAVLAINLSEFFNFPITIVTVIVSALISALTVGGKAIFKGVAIKNSDKIIFTLGRFISIFKK